MLPLITQLWGKKNPELVGLSFARPYCMRGLNFICARFCGFTSFAKSADVNEIHRFLSVNPLHPLKFNEIHSFTPRNPQISLKSTNFLWIQAQIYWKTHKTARNKTVSEGAKGKHLCSSGNLWISEKSALFNEIHIYASDINRKTSNFSVRKDYLLKKEAPFILKLLWVTKPKSIWSLLALWMGPMDRS